MRRRRSVRNIAVLISIGLVSACAAEAPSPEAVASSTGASAAEMLGYLERTVDIADEKFVAMAEAVPDEAWDWRPMEGVRSFREVFIHVAADNWFGGALMGGEVPADVGIGADPTTIGPYQDQVLDREATLRELRRSFDFFGQTLDATRSQLDATTTLGGNEITYGDVWVRLTTHMHEHLGQSIAYARANGFAPPWSR